MVKKITVTADYTSTYYIDDTKAGYTWNFTTASEIQAPKHGIYVLGADNTTLTVAGKVTSTTETSGYSAIGCDSDNFTATVAKTAVVASGTFGIFSSGLDTHVVNHGTVTAPAAVRVDGNGFRLLNDGKLLGESCVIATGDDVSITNLTAGQILGTQYGVTLSSAAGDHARLVNHGTITSYIGVVGDAGSDTIVNDGRINGHVLLEAGNDVVDDRGGTITGNIYGGKGNDTLYVSSIDDRLIEFDKEGTDTVRSTVTYSLDAYVENLYLLGTTKINGTGTDGANKLYGNAGANILVGLNGNDRLDGGAGNDILRGGFGDDTYVFKKGYGVDRIRGFEHDGDHIDTSGWAGMTTFKAISAHATDHGADVWLTFGSDTLIIEGLHKTNLEASFFL